jgi:hypothetical protein
LPLAASTAFSNSTIAQQNQLVADLVAAETSHERAVTGSTHKNHTRSWHRFSRYLESIRIGHNIFHDSFTRSQQNKIIGAFAMALQQGQFLGSAHDTLALGTIRNTILDISAIFRENGQPNPTKDNDLQLSFILHRQFRAFKNADPEEKQQKAIPACVIAIIAKQKLTELQRAILQLTILAFFFAMHSCKYVKVQQHKKGRTKILCLRILRFFKNGRLVDHNDPSLKYANCINITFKMQKKDQKNDTTTQMASGDVTLCPVQAATAIICRIQSYPGANDDRHGARLRGSKSNAINLILRLFSYHFVHTMSS